MVDPLPVTMPAGRHFAVAWGMPDRGAGVVDSLLQRSRALVRRGAVSVDILTFDIRPDYPELGQRLRSRGDLAEGMQIINLWDWMRDYRLPPFAPGTLRLGRHTFAPLRFDSSLTSRHRGGRELSRTRYADDGSVLQTDHYRLDGSLLLSERHAQGAGRGTGGTSVVLCDALGQPLRSWGGMWAFYRYWLDRMRGGIRSYFIVDSEVCAGVMGSYRRKEAVVLRVAGDAQPGNPNDFDAVVFTNRQRREEAVTRFGQHPNLVTIDTPTAGGEEALARGWAAELESARGRKALRPRQLDGPRSLTGPTQTLVSLRAPRAMTVTASRGI